VLPTTRGLHSETTTHWFIYSHSKLHGPILGSADLSGCAV